MHGSKLKNVRTSANEEDGLCIIMVGSYKGIGIGLQEGDPIVINPSEQLRLVAEPRRHPDSTILGPLPLLQPLLPKSIRVRPPISSLLLILLIRIRSPSMEPLLTLLLAGLHLFLLAVLSPALLLAPLKLLPLAFLLLPTFAAAALLLSVSLLAALLALFELGRVVLVLVPAAGLAALELRVFLLVVAVHGGEDERKDEDGSEEEKKGKGLSRCHCHFNLMSVHVAQVEVGFEYSLVHEIYRKGWRGVEDESVVTWPVKDFIATHGCDVCSIALTSSMNGYI